MLDVEVTLKVAGKSKPLDFHGYMEDFGAFIRTTTELKLNQKKVCRTVSSGDGTSFVRSLCKKVKNNKNNKSKLNLSKLLITFKIPNDVRQFIAFLYPKDDLYKSYITMSYGKRKNRSNAMQPVFFLLPFIWKTKTA